VVYRAHHCSREDPIPNSLWTAMDVTASTNTHIPVYRSDSGCPTLWALPQSCSSIPIESLDPVGSCSSILATVKLWYSWCVFSLLQTIHNSATSTQPPCSTNHIWHTDSATWMVAEFSCRAEALPESSPPQAAAHSWHVVWPLSPTSFEGDQILDHLREPAAWEKNTSLRP